MNDIEYYKIKNIKIINYHCKHVIASPFMSFLNITIINVFNIKYNSN